MARLIHNDAIIGNAVKLAMCGAAVAFHPAAVVLGAVVVKDVIVNALSLGIAVAKHKADGKEASEADAEALFEKAKRDFGHDARWDMDADITVQTEVGAFFDQAVLDLVLPTSSLERFRDAAKGGDVYAGIADALIEAMPGHEEKLPTVAHRQLARGILTAAVKSAIQAAGLQDDLLVAMAAGHRARHEEMHAEIMALIRQSGLGQQARDSNISEDAVHAYLDRALEKGFAESDILKWLPEWIERARVVFSTGGNADTAFQRAIAEAEALLEQKGQVNASKPIMDDLARLEIEQKEQAEEFCRRKVLRIEKAIEIDTLALNISGVVEKLFVWAEIEGNKTDEDVLGFVQDKAVSYTTAGQQTKTATPLLIAQEAFATILGRFSQTQTHWQKGTTRHNLGVVLHWLGERLDGEAGFKALMEARAAYEAALLVFKRRDFPYNWAGTQNDLGVVLEELARRLEGATALDILTQARAAYDAALEVYTRDEFPAEWAGAQNNIGVVLRELGYRLDGQAAIEALMEARSIYETVLEIRTRDEFPPEWAGAQNNLAGVLDRLGARLSGEDAFAALAQAHSAYDAALEVWTRLDFPFFWAQTQENLALLAGKFFSNTGDRKYLVEGITLIKNSLEVYHDMRADFYIAKAERLLVALKAAAGIAS